MARNEFVRDGYSWWALPSIWLMRHPDRMERDWRVQDYSAGWFSWSNAEGDGEIVYLPKQWEVLCCG